VKSFKANNKLHRLAPNVLTIPSRILYGNKPGKESKSQIAYRLESEAKAASEALKFSKEKTERDNRLLGRDAHSSTHSASHSIIKSTISSDMSEATQLNTNRWK